MTTAAHTRKPDLRKYYRYRLPEIDPDDLQFRIRILRRGRKPLLITPEELGWQEVDDATGLSATVTLHRPDPLKASSLPVGRRDRIEVSVRWGGDWYKIWTLTLGIPTPDPGTGAVNFDANDEFAPATLSRRDWRYRKDKGHPRGWWGHDAARDVCKKAGIKVRTLPRTKVRITNLKKLNVHPIAVIIAIYEKERIKTGRRFIARFRDGKLEVIPYRRNRVLWVFDQPRDVQVTFTGAVEPITVLTGKGRLGKGKAAKHVRHTERHKDLEKRYGYRHRVKDYGLVEGFSDLRAKVRRDYADGVRLKRSATFTVPMIPFLRRGDGCQLLLPSEGFEGARSFVYITEVNQDAKARTTTLTVEETDPFLTYQKQLDAFRRDQKRKKK